MKRSKFSLSHYKLLSADMGELVPCALTEVLPGDTVQQATSLLVRVSPMVAPVMHPVHVKVHHWYVPHRLVWQDFENFITGGPTGTDASVFPTISSGAGFAVGSLADYLGCPTGVASMSVSALPFRGYSFIWNEWYRDQDLQTALSISRASGVDSTTNTLLQNICWEKDYFTTSRPSPQKGTAVGIPIGISAPVRGLTADTGLTVALVRQNVGTAAAGTNSYSPAQTLQIASKSAIGTAAATAFTDANSNVFADLTSATAATITQLREAFAIQRYKENRMRYGSRYVEYLAAAFNVKSSDGRLDRPEYLAGGKQVIQFSEVLQTGGTSAGAPTGVGNLTGHGIGAVRSNRYRKYFEEHGYIYSFLSVQPKTMYTQGLSRHWNRRIKEDFFQRELQHVGQQPVLNKEVFAASGSPDATFGWQDRYDEYRRCESSVGGEFRTTLDYWHMARIFGSAPALNSTFVQSNPTKRINQVTSADVLWIMANHSIQARRVVSSDGSPQGV
ncbi:MAG: major capsid protein [Microvirus sp.]|nr:MAG: major capsid protein [Microvirus sp.]